MNIMHAFSSAIGVNPFAICTQPFLKFPSLCQSHRCPSVEKVCKLNNLDGRRSNVCPVLPSTDDAISVLDFEDSVEKDWSSLDLEFSNVDVELAKKLDRIISAGNIKETSRVLISLGSEAFVDKLVSSSTFEHLLVVHESLFILASIKEKYDIIKCWQGDLISIPENWGPFNVVFLCFLPAMPLELHQILVSLAKHCSPGARIVISHPQGRQGVAELKQRFPGILVSTLPEQNTLLQTSTDHMYQVLELVDEGGFYLSVLKLTSV